ncbi:DUF4139 domain-containing protein [uncultured Litoreibacter sp.]|uniref:DUF4139 domain-containing protein n=1 Tax=uncultured Litoreibacter sp. TaxID=1392394 RepID=UPI00261AE25E|nr:DUF4139 domain-containing protein [uncultured Litoreibacter sp.]
MFKSVFLSSTVLCALPLYAADFQVNAPVTAATVYPQGATLTRSIAVDIPAGSHRILLPVPPGAVSEGLPRIEGLGALSVGSMEYLPGFVTDAEAVFSDAQAAALAAVDAAEDALQAAQDKEAVSKASIGAISTRILFLQSVSAGALDTLDAAALLAVGDMVSEEIEKSFLAQQAAVEAGRDAEEAVADARKVLTQAQQDLARLTPPAGPINMLAISVDAPEPVATDLSLKHLIGGAYWQASYDLDLLRDASELTMARKVVVSQSTGELWSDVALTLSTADPYAQVDPSRVNARGAQIVKREQKEVFASAAPRSDGISRMVADEAFVEEPVIAERSASVVIDGLSITYDYPDPVSISPNDGFLSLSLGDFAFEAELFNQAAPRFDDTAFLMARFTNDQPEPILPGVVQLYRDGSFVSRSEIDLIPAGDEAVLSFGALEGLRLDYKILNNDTGDRGLLSTSNTRKQGMEFTVQNLTSEVETVETLFALPFTEQEDLVLSVSSQPKPDEMDVEKRRGVSKWLIEVAPGETKTVTMSVNLSWPEGQDLIWRP